ncbi:hypothetical protein ACHQM5_020306 [Ranunculus cassubicifolius]
MTSKARNWKGRFISRAGRLELVNVVLKAIGTYWARTFLLPKVVVSKSNKICNSFLWSGPKLKGKMHQVNSATLRLPKEQGGLGMTDARIWNKAAQVGLIFKIVSRHDSLWVQWIWAQKIKENHFWTMKEQADCSWVWRCLMKMRKKAMKQIKTSIANGERTSLWHDVWCTQEPLLYNQEARQSINLPLNAKVKELIDNHNWNDISHMELREMLAGSKTRLRELRD